MGLAVQLIEKTADGSQGYMFCTVGPVDGPIDAHADHLRAAVRAAISRQYLTHSEGGRWLMDSDEVTGRLVWPAGVSTMDSGRPAYDVIADGKQMTWKEFG